jgi:hypothetical protein
MPIRRLTGSGSARLSQRDLLVHAVVEQPPPRDQHRAVGQAGHRRHPAQERAGERLARLRRERLGHVPVDAQLQPADQPGVPHEQALRAARPQVARGFADAERGALEEGDEAARRSHRRCGSAIECPSLAHLVPSRVDWRADLAAWTAWTAARDPDRVVRCLGAAPGEELAAA